MESGSANSSRDSTSRPALSAPSTCSGARRGQDVLEVRLVGVQRGEQRPEDREQDDQAQHDQRDEPDRAADAAGGICERAPAAARRRDVGGDFVALMRGAPSG